jgi:lipoate-protein ligase A
MKWRLLLDGPGAPAFNMAVDEALLREVKVPVLRIYGWDQPARSIGYFQAWRTAPADQPFVRRYTGGGLVEHGNDATYTVVLPRQHAWMKLSTPESYSKIHEGICAALQRVGVPAQLASECNESDSPSCFEKAVRHDVILNGRKVAGSAQRRTREGLLQQGSILLPDAARNEEFISVLPQIMGEILEFDWKLDEASSAEKELTAKLEKTRYETESWNRRK